MINRNIYLQAFIGIPFSERQLLVVRQIKKLSQNGRKELAEYLKNPNRDICLVLISEEYDDRTYYKKN